MTLHGREILDALLLFLEGPENAPEVKEQALCILGNIASGESSRDMMMTRMDIIKKLTNFMLDENVKLQIAATFCIRNLTWAEEEGSLERQAILREAGVHKTLQQLLSTTDTALFDIVKLVLQQFN